MTVSGHPRIPPVSKRVRQCLKWASPQGSGFDGGPLTLARASPISTELRSVHLRVKEMEDVSIESDKLFNGKVDS